MSETTYFNDCKDSKKLRKMLNIISNKKETKIVQQLHDMPSIQRMRIVNAALLFEEQRQSDYEIVMVKLRAAYSKLFTVGLTQCKKDWKEVWKGLRAANLVLLHDILCSHHRPEIIKMARNMADCSEWSRMDDDCRLLPW